MLTNLCQIILRVTLSSAEKNLVLTPVPVGSARQIMPSKLTALPHRLEIFTGAGVHENREVAGACRLAPDHPPGYIGKFVVGFKQERDGLAGILLFVGHGFA